MSYIQTPPIILLPDRRVVKIMMELVYDRSFTFTTGRGKKSKLSRLKNGITLGSVPAPRPFIIYIAFRLNNMKAKGKLNIMVEGNSLPYNPTPTYPRLWIGPSRIAPPTDLAQKTYLTHRLDPSLSREKLGSTCNNATHQYSRSCPLHPRVLSTAV